MADISLVPGTYNILCCTFEPDVESEFELTVTGSFSNAKQLFELNEKTDWQKSSISGKWAPGTDGGCSNNKNTWMQNPMFKVEVIEKSNIRIMLDSEKVASAVGYYVFSTKDGKKPFELIGKSPFTKPQGAHTISAENWPMEPASYLIMPATFDQKNHGNFVVNVYSDHKVCKLSVAHVG